MYQVFTKQDSTKPFIDRTRDINVLIEHILNQTEQVVLVHHKKCNDGVVAAAIVKKAIEANYRNITKIDHVEASYGINHAQRIANFVDYEQRPFATVVFVDYCPTEQEINALTRSFFVIVVDHHQTAVDKIRTWHDQADTRTASRALIVMDENNSMSGAQMARHLFGSNFQTVLVDHIDRYDRFDKNENWITTQAVAAYVKNIIASNTDLDQRLIAVSNFMTTRAGDAEDLALDFGASYKSITTAFANNAIASGIKFKDAQGTLRAVVYSADKSSISDIAEAIRQIDDQIYFSIGIAVNAPSLEMSVRSSLGAPIDALTIAETFGGGGHKLAAGFVIGTAALNSVLLQISSLVFDLNKPEPTVDVPVKREPIAYPQCDKGSGTSTCTSSTTTSGCGGSKGSCGCSGATVSPHTSNVGTINGLIPYADTTCKGSCGTSSNSTTQYTSNKGGCGCGC